MVNATKSKAVGDSRSRPLMATESGLRAGAEQAKRIFATGAMAATQCSPVGEIAATNSGEARKSGIAGCRQTLWISFFFDGTGNNLDADLSLNKHSNIAKLYLVRKEEDIDTGVYSVYIPGIATYFPAIGDDGGTAAGKVAGDMGVERLQYALKEMDARLRRHLEMARAPSNIITEINIAVFGFSRGAALARAFINLLIEKKCNVVNGKLTFKQGNWPLRVRFAGLFDTVASVGLPMSSNTTEIYGAVFSKLERIVRRRLESHEKTRPQALAFSENGRPGADPAPGPANGHRSYADNLKISGCVDEVRHFVAAHEMRNSFPLESVSIFENGITTSPPHFYEVVYPGVHSDLGGSYAPGEGGKNASEGAKFGVIPLLHMYQYAIRAGAPLLVPSAWKERNKEDFAINQKLIDCYNYYRKMIPAASSLGDGFNHHMGLYFAWRFRSIRMKKSGDKSASAAITAAAGKFKAVSVPVDTELGALEEKVSSACNAVSILNDEIRDQELNGGGSDANMAKIKQLRADLEPAQAKYEIARKNMLKEKSIKDAIPDMTKYQTLLDLYDNQLMLDAQAILATLAGKPARTSSDRRFSRADLRPHYRVLIDAYEAEFVHHRGLTDKVIIEFFDEYIHDSLAGFGSDATIPSDPRVVYLGGEIKYEYASRDSEENEARVA